MKKVYFTPITYKSIFKNDNWKIGGHAITTMSDNPEMKSKAEVEQYGKTKEEAEKKIMRFLTSGGTVEAICVKQKEKAENSEKQNDAT